MRADEPGMDIASLATSVKQLEVSNNISIAVARKAMDAQKQQGDAAIQLLEAAAKTAPGGANPDGLGGRVDVAA
jgi:hypothetical protein